MFFVFVFISFILLLFYYFYFTKLLVFNKRKNRKNEENIIWWLVNSPLSTIRYILILKRNLITNCKANSYYYYDYYDYCDNKMIIRWFFICEKFMFYYYFMYAFTIKYNYWLKKKERHCSIKVIFICVCFSLFF